LNSGRLFWTQENLNQNMAQLPLYYKNLKRTGSPPSKQWKEYYLMVILFVAFIILIPGVLWFLPDVEVNLSYDKVYDHFTGGIDTTRLSEPTLTHTEVPSLESGNGKIVQSPPVLINSPSANISSPVNVKLPMVEEQKQNNSAASRKVGSEIREEPLISDEDANSATPATMVVNEENERRRLKIIEVSGSVSKLICTNGPTGWMFLCL